ncbi:MAG: hypothetical protein Q8L88_08190 [Bacteroidota bacterium]|nr:hypothetical protein [Bacteroidota bacterium]
MEFKKFYDWYKKAVEYFDTFYKGIIFIGVIITGVTTVVFLIKPYLLITAFVLSIIALCVVVYSIIALKKIKPEVQQVEIIVEKQIEPKTQLPIEVVHNNLLWRYNPRTYTSEDMPYCPEHKLELIPDWSDGVMFSTFMELTCPEDTCNLRYTYEKTDFEVMRKGATSKLKRKVELG